MSRLLFCPLLFLATASAQEENSFALHELLVSAKLPDGYKVTSQKIKNGDNAIGYAILASKPNQESKVSILIESRDPSTIQLTMEPARRAAAKAYVNTSAAAIARLGFKVVEKHIPDIVKETFQKPVSVDLVFANAQGKKLWSHHEIFFTDKGFAVQVLADNQETFEALTKWAKTIKPKTMP